MVSARAQNSRVPDSHVYALMLYEIALQDPSWHPEEVICRSGWTAEELNTAIKYLHRLGLLVHATATRSGWLAISTETVLEKELVELNGQVTTLLGEMTFRQKSITRVLADFRAVHLRQQSAADAEYVSGTGVVTALEHALHSASSEVVVLSGSHIGSIVPAESYLPALQRGVSVRIVHRSAPTSVPQLPHSLQQVITLGAEIRTTATFPFEIMVVDGSLAFLPAPGEFLPNEYPDFIDLMVIRNGLTATILRGMFMSCRAEALVVPNHVSRRAGKGTLRVSPRQRALLHLLAAGMTDKAVGRKLGITERTVRRQVADLMILLNAESRFQLGLNASIAGLIDGNT
jgi:DNA-binding CsgD family transcriptional regulator